MASGLRRLAHDLVPHDYVNYQLVERSGDFQYPSMKTTI
jgi:hypothetical protein